MERKEHIMAPSPQETQNGVIVPTGAAGGRMLEAGAREKRRGQRRGGRVHMDLQANTLAQ